MLFVNVIHLCATVLLTITRLPYSHAVQDDTQSQSLEETDSLLKFITENASSVSLIKEIADELEKEEADAGNNGKKESLRWGKDTGYDLYNTYDPAINQPLPGPTLTARPQQFTTDKPQPTASSLPLGDHQNLNHNSPQNRDVIQTYVDNVLTHQSVPVLLLHVSLTGVQQNDRTLSVSFPINVNLDRHLQNNDAIPVTPDFNQEQRIGNSKPLRTVDQGILERDDDIAKAIREKIQKTKPGRLLFADLAKRNQQSS